MQLPSHLARSIRTCPDPDRAAASLARLLSELDVWELAENLFDPQRLEEANRLIRLLAVSHVALKYILLDPVSLGLVLQGGSGLSEWIDREAAYLLEQASTSETDTFRSELLRFRRRAWMRIVAADLSGDQATAECMRAYSAAADSVLAAAWRHLGCGSGLAAIALGKLGGRELNYSSDVDVIFVAGDRDSVDTPETKARTLITFLGGEVAMERVLLVDPDLRPEGRAGPLVRSLSSFERYWDEWAEPWELQSLIKARPVLGPAGLGEAFIEAASRRLWPEVLDPEAIKSIRQMKRRTEAHAARRTRTFDVKRSSGGIRDVEMAVQLLQLIHGRHDASLRSPNTLEAVKALSDGDYVSSEDGAELVGAYLFLRDVEHRLQIRNDSARHDLPSDRASVRVLAKSLGFSDSKEAAAEELFQDEFSRVTSTVRQLHRRLFFRPLLEAFASLPKSATADERAATMSQDTAEERLRALGFVDVRQARVGLEELTRGISRRSRLMAQLMPLILEWLSESPDPSAGLVNLRKLVEAVGDQVVLVSTFRENAAAVQRLCKVLGTSRVLSDLLVHDPGGIHALADDQELFSTKSPTALREEARSFTSWRSGYREKLDGLARFSRKELLRTATRDLLLNDRTQVEVVAGELCGIAEGVLSVATDAALEDVGAEGRLRFCVVGLGSLGANEMAYSSDMDVMFIYETSGPTDGNDLASVGEVAHSVATRLLADLRALAGAGYGASLDADLRPEGRAGVLVRSLESTISYYRNWADTWEFQALAKARPVAGDPSLFDALLEAISDLVWPDPFPAAREREIRLMKARVERERLPASARQRFNLKLGPGGLNDVQFLVELYALRHAGAHPDLRSGSTLEKLRGLAEAGVLSQEDAARLEEAYLFCSHVRNRIFLIKGRPLDEIPERPEDAVVLAESLGYVGHPRSHLMEDFRRVTRRARSTFEKLFYMSQ